MQCSSCGHANPEGQKFCGECGTRLEAGTAIADQTAPRAYTPPHLAEKILKARSALEGERKPVTVLFCDIADSTALAERLGPERMHTVLNAFFEAALAEVHRYEGTVNQFLGDGFMALFGAPVAHEDHARRAVLAARAIRHALTAESFAARDAALRLRMGLNSGVHDAFNLDKVPMKQLDRYGRNSFGWSLLMARRMLETGVSLVQVNLGNNESWDTHQNAWPNLKNFLLPPMDKAVSALLDDLECSHGIPRQAASKTRFQSRRMLTTVQPKRSAVARIGSASGLVTDAPE